MKREVKTIDATGRIAGRLASEIAVILQGKHKPSFQPDKDLGDAVEVSNVDKIKFSGKKLDQKKYYRHSGYPGGIKSELLRDKLNQKPDQLLKEMVRLMLPKNRLQNDRLKRLTFVK